MQQKQCYARASRRDLLWPAPLWQLHTLRSGEASQQVEEAAEGSVSVWRLRLRGPRRLGSISGNTMGGSRMILRAAKALALSGALIFSTGLIAQQNGQYNDPNYNNNQNGQYNNGQYDRDHDRDRDRDQYNQGPYDSNGYNNYGYNQNGEYNRQYDRQYSSQYTQPPYENNGYNNYGYNQNGQYDRQYDRQYGRRYASNGNGRYGDTISSGTQIKVRTDQDINLKADDDNNGRGVTAGQVFPA